MKIEFIFSAFALTALVGSASAATNAGSAQTFARIERHWGLSPWEWSWSRESAVADPHLRTYIDQRVGELGSSAVVVLSRDGVALWERDEFEAWRQWVGWLNPDDIQAAGHLEGLMEKILRSDDSIPGISEEALRIVRHSLRLRAIDKAQDAFLDTLSFYVMQLNGAGSRDGASAVRSPVQTEMALDIFDTSYFSLNEEQRDFLDEFVAAALRGETISDLEELVLQRQDTTYFEREQEYKLLLMEETLDLQDLAWDTHLRMPTQEAIRDILRALLLENAIRHRLFETDSGIRTGQTVLSVSHRLFLASHPELLNRWRWVAALDPETRGLALHRAAGAEARISQFRLIPILTPEMGIVQVSLSLTASDAGSVVPTIDLHWEGGGLFGESSSARRPQRRDLERVWLQLIRAYSAALGSERTVPWKVEDWELDLRRLEIALPDSKAFHPFRLASGLKRLGRSSAGNEALQAVMRQKSWLPARWTLTAEQWEILRGAFSAPWNLSCEDLLSE